MQLNAKIQLGTVKQEVSAWEFKHPSQTKHSPIHSARQETQKSTTFPPLHSFIHSQVFLSNYSFCHSLIHSSNQPFVPINSPIQYFNQQFIFIHRNVRPTFIHSFIFEVAHPSIRVCCSILSSIYLPIRPSINQLMHRTIQKCSRTKCGLKFTVYVKTRPTKQASFQASTRWYHLSANHSIR